jgi:hypothetical protein
VSERASTDVHAGMMSACSRAPSPVTCDGPGPGVGEGRRNGVGEATRGLGETVHGGQACARAGVFEMPMASLRGWVRGEGG